MRRPDCNFGWKRARSLAFLGALTLNACGGASKLERVEGAGAESGTGGSTPAAGSGGANAGTAGGGAAGTGAAGTGGLPPADCVGPSGSPIVPQRLVRLSPSQLANSVGALLNPALAAEIAAAEDLPPPEHRPFPPLAAAGTVIGDTLFAMSERVARQAGQYVLENFDALSGCGETPSLDCAREFVLGFAERAFRRPLGSADRDAVLALEAELVAIGASAPETAQFGVQAALLSPHYLYRYELGIEAGTDAEVTLAPHELADELAFFLTDAPPDAELLAAAAAGKLSSEAELEPHVARLLASEPARRNLEAALVSYFGLPGARTVIISGESVPGITVTTGLLDSIYREGELFIQNTVWDGPLSSLLSSRRTWANEQTALPIYGVSLGPDVDADGFGPIELDEKRAGLLTLSPFLTSRAQPDRTSVVARGLQVNAAIVCAFNPPFPEEDPDIIEDITSMVGWSERERAAYRQNEPLCDGCHRLFDPFGLALDVFDTLGRYRTEDREGRPIDPTTTLPETVGSVAVSGPVEMAQVLAESREFHACMAMKLFDFALSDISQGSAGAVAPESPTRSCTVSDLVERHGATDRSFASLVTQIALSPEFRLRYRAP